MKSIDEINLAAAEGLTSGLILIDHFLEYVTRANFDEILALMHPDMQELVTMHAKECAHDFDAIIAELRERPVMAEAWLAYKEWAHRQPWFEAVLDVPRRRRWASDELDLFCQAEGANELLQRATARRAKAQAEGGDAVEWDPLLADLAKDAARMTEAYEEMKAGLDAAHAAREDERVRQRKQQRS